MTISWSLGFSYVIIWNILKELRGSKLAIPAKIHLIGNHLLNSLLSYFINIQQYKQWKMQDNIFVTFCISNYFLMSFQILLLSSVELFCMQAPKGQTFPNLSLMLVLCELRLVIKLTEEQIHLLPCIVTSQRDN